MSTIEEIKIALSESSKLYETKKRKSQARKSLENVRRMRALTFGIKIQNELITQFGNFGGLFKGKKKANYLGVFIEIDPESLDFNSKHEIRSVQQLSSPSIQTSIQRAVNMFESGLITQTQLEQVQDLLYAELGRRLEKK